VSRVAGLSGCASGEPAARRRRKVGRRPVARHGKSTAREVVVAGWLFVTCAATWLADAAGIAAMNARRACVGRRAVWVILKVHPCPYQY